MQKTATSSSEGGGGPPLAVIALGWAGLLPFAACTLLAWHYFPELPEPGPVLLAYGLAIVCFLCGTLWGTAQHLDGAAKTRRLCVSNALVLIAVAAVIFAAEAVALALLIVVYWLVVVVEWLGGSRGWYLRYRLQLTAAVSILLGLFLLAPVSGA